MYYEVVNIVIGLSYQKQEYRWDPHFPERSLQL